MLTISILSISKRRRHSDEASLSYAHTQEALVHTGNQPPNSNICVIGAHTRVAAESDGRESLQVCM